MLKTYADWKLRWLMSVWCSNPTTLRWWPLTAARRRRCPTTFASVGHSSASATCCPHLRRKQPRFIVRAAGRPFRKIRWGPVPFCGTRIDSGEFQWYVRNITLLSREAKVRCAHPTCPRWVLHYPSVIQPNLQNNRIEFEKNPEFFGGGVSSACAANLR